MEVKIKRKWGVFFNNLYNYPLSINNGRVETFPGYFLGNRGNYPYPTYWGKTFFDGTF